MLLVEVELDLSLLPLRYFQGELPPYGSTLHLVESRGVMLLPHPPGCDR